MRKLLPWNLALSKRVRNLTAVLLFLDDFFEHFSSYSNIRTQLTRRFSNDVLNELIIHVLL